MDDRKLEVLRAIVSDYVTSREPVGSKALVDRHRLNVSPATVRNDMAALEEEGYITQPHTSAGRIPTDKGYRLFVDRLSGVKPLSPAEKRAISSFLAGAVDVDDIVLRTTRLLAEITHQVAIVQYPVMHSDTVRHVELVGLSTERLLVILVTSTGRVDQRIIEAPGLDEESLAAARDALSAAVVGRAPDEASLKLAGVVADEVPAEQRGIVVPAAAALVQMMARDPSTRVVVGGVTNVARFGPDYVGSVQPVLEALEEQVVLLRLLSDVAESGDVTVLIGQENAYEKLQTTSLVASSYGDVGEPWASLGIVGPTRMDYPSTMAAVRAVARYVGRYLAEG